MHEFEFQFDSCIHALHTPRQKALPKFSNPWGATSMCEQISIGEKRCNMTCYFTQQVKKI